MSWMTKLSYCLYILLIFYCNLYMTPGSLADSNTSENSRISDSVSDEDIPIEAKAFTKLLFVSVLFRHGDRTPDTIETYSNDPYKNDTFYPIGRGELTNVGKERSYQLGRILRRLYDRFLGPIYYQTHVYARSTFITRCKMTLQLVLAALFPPTSVQKWNDALLWQPMNMKYGSMKEDNLLMAFKGPKYIKALEEVMNSPEILEQTTKYRDLMKNVSAYTKEDVNTLYDLAAVRIALNMQLSMKLEIPKAAHDLYANKQLLEATRLAYDMYIYTEQLIRLNGGVLLRKIIEDMNKVINGTLTDRKINLFSGHDVNVMGLLAALHIRDEIYSMPHFTSGVILELRARNDKYFVKVLYYNGIPGKIQTLVIPGCKLLCPYDRFLQLTSTLVARNTDLIGPLSLEEDLFRH